MELQLPGTSHRFRGVRETRLQYLYSSIPTLESQTLHLCLRKRQLHPKNSKHFLRIKCTTRPRPALERNASEPMRRRFSAANVECAIPHYSNHCGKMVKGPGTHPAFSKARDATPPAMLSEAQPATTSMFKVQTTPLVQNFSKSPLVP